MREALTRPGRTPSQTDATEQAPPAPSEPIFTSTAAVPPAPVPPAELDAVHDGGARWRVRRVRRASRSRSSRSRWAPGSTRTSSPPVTRPMTRDADATGRGPAERRSCCRATRPSPASRPDSTDSNCWCGGPRGQCCRGGVAAVVCHRCRDRARSGAARGGTPPVPGRARRPVPARAEPRHLAACRTARRLPSPTSRRSTPSSRRSPSLRGSPSLGPSKTRWRSPSRWTSRRSSTVPSPNRRRRVTTEPEPRTGRLSRPTASRPASRRGGRPEPESATRPSGARAADARGSSSRRGAGGPTGAVDCDGLCHRGGRVD